MGPGRAAGAAGTAADLAVAEKHAAEREKTLRDREVAVAIKERNIVAREKAIKDAAPPRFTPDPTGAPGTISHSGLAREAFNG
jgi:hypothetical protein